MPVVHTEPIYIYKAFVGQIGIWLAGIAVTLLLLGLGLFMQPTNAQFASILEAVALIAVLVTLIWSTVYSSSRMILGLEELDVVNRPSLLTSNIGTLEWNQVQDIELRVSSFGSIFGYGTLVVHAANDQRDLIFTMTPKPKHWHDYMMRLAEDATTPVSEQQP